MCHQLLLAGQEQEPVMSSCTGGDWKGFSSLLFTGSHFADKQHPLHHSEWLSWGFHRGKTLETLLSTAHAPSNAESRRGRSWAPNKLGPQGDIGRALNLDSTFNVSFHYFTDPTEPTSISERLAKCRGIKLLMDNSPKNAFWQLYCLAHREKSRCTFRTRNYPGNSRNGHPRAR